MKRYLAEFLGTFALVFCGTGAMVINEVTNGAVSHVGVASTWGLIVMAMIYCFGNTSGAHINPAVSIAFSLTKVFNRKLLLAYILVQIAGAIVASLVLKFLFPTSITLGATLPAGSWQQSFILEFILTFLLMMVILFVSQQEESKKFTAIAVGGVVGLEAMFAGPICGASMNPARSIAPAFISGHLTHLWIYLVSTILGALLASLTWLYFQKK